jgi:hypothetical protein
VSDVSIPSVGQFAEYLWRGERRYGTTLSLQGRFITLDLRQDERLEERKQFARHLIANSDALVAAFDRFTQAEAARLPAFAEQILGLEISEITFHDRERVTFGEVYFTLESGQDQFFCGFDTDRFTGMVIER